MLCPLQGLKGEMGPAGPQGPIGISVSGPPVRTLQVKSKEEMCRLGSTDSRLVAE